MEARLKSTLKRIPWSLLARLGVLAVLLALGSEWLFLFTAGVLYVRSGPRRFEFWSLFFLTLWVALQVMNGAMLLGNLSDTLLRNETQHHVLTGYAIPLEETLSYALPLFLFLLLFGVKELLFERRRYAVLILTLTLVFWGSLQFFLQAVRFGTIAALWPLVPFVTLLFWGWFSAFEISPPKRALGVAVVALVALELLWAFTLLPLGFLNASAAIVLLFWLVARSYAAYASERLSPQKSLAFASFGAAGLALIFILSNWRL